MSGFSKWTRISPGGDGCLILDGLQRSLGSFFRKRFIFLGGVWWGVVDNSTLAPAMLETAMLETAMLERVRMGSFRVSWSRSLRSSSEGIAVMLTIREWGKSRQSNSSKSGQPSESSLSSSGNGRNSSSSSLNSGNMFIRLIAMYDAQFWVLWVWVRSEWVFRLRGSVSTHIDHRKSDGYTWLDGVVSLSPSFALRSTMPILCVHTMYFCISYCTVLYCTPRLYSICDVIKHHLGLFCQCVLFSAYGSATHPNSYSSKSV